MKEAELQNAIIELAQLLRWSVFHPRTVRTAAGHHLTAFQGDAGFPDLVLAHPRHGVIFAELKSSTGSLTPAQQTWRNVLEAAGAEYHLWKPAMWPAIESRLKGEHE